MNRPLKVALAVSGLYLAGINGQLVPQCAFAEPAITGPPDAVRLEAHQETIADLLSALERNYNVQHKSIINLDGVVSGTFDGSLPQIISRLLEGYDYILGKSGDAVSITIYRVNRNSLPVAAPWPPPAPQNQNAVMTVLDRTLRPQLPRPRMAATTATAAVTPRIEANKAPDVREMTRNASAAVDHLKEMLDRLPRR